MQGRLRTDEFIPWRDDGPVGVEFGPSRFVNPDGGIPDVSGQSNC
jgi:hypothetical protein